MRTNSEKAALDKQSGPEGEGPVPNYAVGGTFFSGGAEEQRESSMEDTRREEEACT